jgi:hypothetical protein
MKNFLRNILGLATRLSVLGFLMASSHGGYATDYADKWGPEVGSSSPLLAAPDHRGATQSLATLAGENGLLLIFNRSVDW